MREDPANAPTLAGEKIPTLLFADDTLLMSKTPSGLQKLLDRFSLFCEERGLIINTTKTKLMVLSQTKKSRKINVALNGSMLEEVDAFDYLGVRVNYRMKWDTHVAKMLLNLKRVSGAISRDHRASFSRPIAPALAVYDGKALAATVYESELWGFDKTAELVKAENTFLRDLVGLPFSTPLKPLLHDMGRRSIKDIVCLRPLLYWVRLRRTPELAS